MKLKEFWIQLGKRGGPKKCGVKLMTGYHVRVREVSPELDAAYVECEMVLTALLETAECREDEDCDHCVGMNSLAALKKARGE